MMKKTAEALLAGTTTALLAACSSTPTPAMPGVPAWSGTSPGNSPTTSSSVDLSTLSPGFTPATPSTTASSSYDPQPQLRAIDGFLTVRYDCTWPAPGTSSTGREQMAPQEAWAKERRKPAALKQSRSLRYISWDLHGAAVAELLKTWGEDDKLPPRIKAQLTGARSIRAWVTVVDPVSKDFGPKAAASARAIVRPSMTMQLGELSPLSGNCTVGPGGRPLPPQAMSIDDDTTNWKE
ncbi:hypothetical protein [Terrabacter sp. MAHUQ-38]|uniref:hypothetical protein n=1 Tax=unclassified Terrabacter TaxID=2630222 RepID=UPI00165DB89B|nr:hypothetical protein [Terrabacter sp. MAHUQ-38]MBC9822886.1 hypothetical protein [Terrabacter sp. MAHUQ-38]